MQYLCFRTFVHAPFSRRRLHRTFALDRAKHKVCKTQFMNLCELSKQSTGPSYLVRSTGL